jgi:hypothetical protein
MKARATSSPHREKRNVLDQLMIPGFYHASNEIRAGYAIRIS